MIPLRRIALLSPPIGNGNLGDEAIVAAVIQNIRRCQPHAAIYVISPNPDETRKRHGIEAYPIASMPRQVPGLEGDDSSTRVVQMTTRPRDIGLWKRARAVLRRFPLVYRLLKVIHAMPNTALALLRELAFLTASWKQLKDTDLIVLAGSGPLCDHWYGPFHYPYTIFKWSLLAKASRIPMAFLSVGAGPLRSRLSRLLVRASLALASYRSARDVTSRQILDDLGLFGETPVFPDLAYGLEIALPPPRRRSHRAIVGVNPFPHFDPRFWPESDPVKYQRYITCLASFTTWLIHNDYRVLLFPTQIRADVRVIHDLKRLISHDTANLTQSLLELPIHDVPELLSALALTDVVVATRFHGILLSFLLNRPVLGISNHHKMSDLMRSMGQSQYLLDIDSITFESLTDRFTLLESNREAVTRELAHHVTEFRRALDQQYTALLSTSPSLLSPNGTPVSFTC